jgi:hypothetical protein
MSEKNAPARIIESVGTRTVSRRTVARGIAWTTPVVAVATAAPAFAVSRVPPKLEFLGACKFPGNSCSTANKGYAFAFTVTNNDGRALSFCSASLTINDPNPFPGVNFIYTGGCFTVGGGETGTAYFYFEGSADSANSPFTGSLTVTYANDCASCATDSVALAPIPVVVTETPPKGLCKCGSSFIPS